MVSHNSQSEREGNRNVNILLRKRQRKKPLRGVRDPKMETGNLKIAPWELGVGINKIVSIPTVFKEDVSTQLPSWTMLLVISWHYFQFPVSSQV